MIQQTALTPCQQLARIDRRALAPRTALGALNLPIVGSIDTKWILIAAAAVALFYFMKRRRARKRRVRRIIRRVTEY